METSTPEPTQDNNVESSPAIKENKGSFFTEEAIKELVSNTAKQAINEYKQQLDLERQQIEENSKQMQAAINAGQATLLKSQSIPSQVNEKLLFVNKVLSDNEELKRAYPGQSPTYLNDDMGLLKSKIIVMKRLGMTEEDIANTL